ncbi:MAG: hypothetical protein KKG99_11495 [Bacteroidetes bacterium]|nr:hypothetical protein [Bacteroidota bacterium]
MKRILKILAGIIAACGVVVLIYVVSLKQEEVKCIGMRISINYPEQDIFIEKSEIEEIVKTTYGDIYSVAINVISTEKLENLFSQNPYIRSANVYSNIQGELIIDIVQRQPIFRLEMPRGSFYVDNYGSYMPLSPQYVPRLVIVSGFLKSIDINNEKGLNLNNQAENSEIAPIIELVKFIRKDTFLSALIEQIYVNKDREIELIPKLGKQYILLGKAEHVEEKLNKLQIFYEQGMPINGWDAYEMINIKFKNQVVCTKI